MGLCASAPVDERAEDKKQQQPNQTHNKEIAAPKDNKASGDAGATKAAPTPSPKV